jgi:F0F1-type ATP synthase assembly protein I
MTAAGAIAATAVALVLAIIACVLVAAFMGWFDDD